MWAQHPPLLPLPPPDVTVDKRDPVDTCQVGIWVCVAGVCVRLLGRAEITEWAVPSKRAPTPDHCCRISCPTEFTWASATSATMTSQWLLLTWLDHLIVYLSRAFPFAVLFISTTVINLFSSQQATLRGLAQVFPIRFEVRPGKRRPCAGGTADEGGWDKVLTVLGSVSGGQARWARGDNTGWWLGGTGKGEGV